MTSSPRLSPDRRDSSITTDLTAEGETIDIWRASLNVAPSALADLALSLSADEKERADRFHFAADRRRFITARATLRALLGRYTGQAPADIEFAYAQHGKPSLKSRTDTPPLFFNLSHTADTALYAITRKGPVGIDIEECRADFAVDAVIPQFFSDAEAAILFALPPSLRTEQFYRYWSRKEAYCKVTGDGLAQDIKRLNVSVEPSSPHDWFSVYVDSAPNPRILLRDLETRTSCKAALAIEGSATSLRIQKIIEY